MSRVLVTGGAGYIGSILTRNLLKSGYTVRLMDKFNFGLESVKDITAEKNLELIIGDIRKTSDVQKALEGVDSVVHLAAIVGDPACSVQADVAVETNYLATLNLARTARENRVKKFIFTSTCSVYGASDSEMLDENSGLNPMSLYAETKIDAENGLRSLENERFKPTILRLGTIYGLSYRMRFDLVINYLTKKILFENKGMIFGGEQWRPFIHVRDVSKGIQMILEAADEKVLGETFNLGVTKENYQMNNIGIIFQEVFPKADIQLVREVRDKRSYRINFEKIRNNIGFKGTNDVKSGILEIKKAIENGDIKNPDDKIYYNYLPGGDNK